MAHSPFSLLLLRRLSLSPPPSPSLLPHLLAAAAKSGRSFTSQASPAPSSPSSDPKRSSLSARMSFIFDQIDAIEKERSEKDETLQRIRAWRQSKKDPAGVGIREPEPEAAVGAEDASGAEVVERVETKGKEIELLHPWPEWIELLERLVHQNYFDFKRRDEEKMMKEMGYVASDLGLGNDSPVNLTKNFKAVLSACLTFGKDRFDILRYLSRKDIQILVGFGCPIPDLKVMLSAKLLRKFVHIDEGDVCSACSLRNSCKKAYLTTNKEDEAHTSDIMRILFTFAFDPINGVLNDSIVKRKNVKASARKLLHQVVKLGSVPIDPNLTPPVIKKPPPKVKQPPPPPRKRVGRDDVEMKKGDWLCSKCDFMNFAKNKICLQCDAKRPKRHLLPGEWECPKCDFLNYRRNISCFHCECKRPEDTYVDDERQEKPYAPRSRLEKIANRQEISNAWNFDFDDDESDGADVAAFEYADPSLKAQGPHSDNQARENWGLPERQHPDTGKRGPGTGFDDFVDEEDDIDSYEIDTSVNNSASQSRSINFSDIEGHSGSEDGNDSDDVRNVSTSNKRPKTSRRQAMFSGSEDDELDPDYDITDKRKWEPSRLADPRQKTRGSGSRSRGNLSHGSDEDLDSDFDDDLDIHRRSRPGGRREHFQRRGGSRSDSDDFGRGSGSHRRESRGNQREQRRGGSRSDSDDFGRGSGSHKHESRRNQREQNRRGSDRRAREAKSNNFRNGRKNKFDDDFADSDDEPRRSRSTNERSRGNNRSGRGTYSSGADKRDFRGPKEGFKRQQPGRYNNEYGSATGKEFKNSRRVIER